MNKKELRKLFLDKRKQLGEGDYARLNLALYAQFFAGIDLSFIRVLHSFLPIPDNHEPDTWAILDRIRREFPQVRISLPRVSGDHLENIYFEGPHQLETNAWGIREPKQGVPTPTEKLDLVIVPLLIFDKRGHRVGYGKGYYDRLLSQVRPDCLKVGLSLFPPVDAIDDLSATDVPLDQCVMPEGVIGFRDQGT
ncbi:MAG: 5-formyltetrahydrofolate cyclo-ligase [Cyclobacteriaceae bacterium]|nr:5-formyltetrahydrofolate cyclo-ligase [Cyclobacteriaceae bacterium]